MIVKTESVVEDDKLIFLHYSLDSINLTLLLEMFLNCKAMDVHIHAIILLYFDVRIINSLMIS